MVHQIPDRAIPCTISPTGIILSEYAKEKSPSNQRKDKNRLILKHKILIAVSDASVIEDRATWAVVIAKEEGEISEEKSGNAQCGKISSS